MQSHGTVSRKPHCCNGVVGRYIQARGLIRPCSPGSYECHSFSVISLGTGEGQGDIQEVS